MKREPTATRIRSGKMEFHRLNANRRDVRDAYHWLLTLTWPQFAAFIGGVYLAINLLFSILYELGRPCIAEVKTFSDAFFFSIETMATVGYGHFYPDTLFGHIVATIEIMTGMFGMAVVTGLIFIRFSRPTARILFSDKIVIGPFDGELALMIRIANLRQHAMAEAEFHVMLIRDEPLKEGDSMRRFYPLKLQFDRLITFPVALTLRHIIDETSPLHGWTLDALKKSESRILASVVCIDTVIPASVQSQQDYVADDIHFGRRFVEIYRDLPDGSMTVDYGRFHDTEEARHPAIGQKEV